MVDLNDRESIREFVKQNNIKEFIQPNDLSKKMMGTIIEEMLEAERDEYLGYQRYQRSDTTNSRNGYSSNMVRSSQGDIRINIPRDRKGQSNQNLLRSTKGIYPR